MAITPTGGPAWLRTAAFTTYGGHSSKENYLSRGAIDANTDVAAEEFSRMVSDVAATVRTAPFAVIGYLNNDSSPAAPTVETVYMMTGVRTSSYAGGSPPTGFPSAARNGNGDVTFTFAASYADEYGVTGVYAPTDAHATANGTTALTCVCTVSGSTVRVRVFDDTGAAVQNARVTLTVQ